MSKLNKYANLYDKDGNLIRHIDEKTGKLEDYTMEELKELVDKLANDKDENGKVKDPVGLNNASWMLMHYHQRYGNPYIEEWLEEFKKKQSEKSLDEQTQEKLKEVEREIEMQENNSTVETETQTEVGLIPTSEPDVSPETVSTESIEDPNEIVSHVELNLEPEYVDFEEVTQE